MHLLTMIERMIARQTAAADAAEAEAEALRQRTLASSFARPASAPAAGTTHPTPSPGFSTWPTPSGLAPQPVRRPEEWHETLPMVWVSPGER